MILLDTLVITNLHEICLPNETQNLDSGARLLCAQMLYVKPMWEVIQNF